MQTNLFEYINFCGELDLFSMGVNPTDIHNFCKDLGIDFSFLTDRWIGFYDPTDGKPLFKEDLLQLFYLINEGGN